MTILSTYMIGIKGLVQGVGFRPFIYHLSQRYSINGWVENRNDGVFIKATGGEKKIFSFYEDISLQAPAASKIISTSIEKIKVEDFTAFEIRKSCDSSNKITQISPDIAVCNACLDDLSSQKHRIDYPFINCTNCGPRFSIIRDLPYDREKTTMQKFVMCPVCRSEYNNILDRRFHAQPVACNSCGPQYQLLQNGEIVKEYNEILSHTAQYVEEGKIIAVKGIGGFHLMCDAFNIETVKKLRERKLREGKAFAVLFSNLDEIKKNAHCSVEEEKILRSWQRPIVILSAKKDFNPHVSNGLNTIGSMLPYTAFHFQLFEKINTSAVVLTSANISDQPIIIDNDEAIEKLREIADSFLIFNRDIYNRCDDSVSFVVNSKKRMIRRSRGYVPSPVITEKLNVEGIFAAGAELSNCFAVGRGKEAMLSQHIGDLKNLETFSFYKESISRFEKLFRIKKQLIVCDLHPDYLSSQYAKELAEREKLPLVEVQHHHAHIAACMGEHDLDEKLIGISFDGTGMGDDGTIWGGEFLVCDLNEYERICHFESLPLPGGDKANKEPWRMAVSYLYKAYGKDFRKWDIPLFKFIDNQKINLITQMVEKQANAPLSSSAGRLFDAVAAICGVTYYNTFQAEAPMRLESLIDKNECECFPYTIDDDELSFLPMICEIAETVSAKKNIGIIAAKFHNTVASACVDLVQRIAQKNGLKKVVLSGGVFQNRYLLEIIENKLEDKGFTVYAHSRIPSNDGGIALGQLLIAAKRRTLFI